ncbi:MAG: response regulator [bacterium]|nr:response regulator [Gammaproteobacteria bacterium]HIL94368.1 response regulator [Pseudomonadales bacterium]
MIKQTVLFVDDESKVLQALKRLCRKEPFTMEFACSGVEALEIMTLKTIDLVVSDLRMPEMDGSELLAEIEKLYPDIPRVLLSGNADLPSVVKSLNEGKLSYYFEKPWPDDRFRFVLRGLLNQRGLEQKYKALLETVSSQNETLIRQAEKISEQVELKDRLFAVMSHEIRTPLNGIHGVLQLMQDHRELDAKCRRLIDVALSSSTDLGRIVNDILDYSKIDSGEMQLEVRPFCVSSLIEDIYELMLPVAESKNIQLKCDTNLCDKELFFEGDDHRIRQVIMNIVSNAIKFTESGWVKIHAPTIADSDLKISVEDTGIGISEDRQALLFEEYKMLGTTHARKFGGTGLGLSICKRLIKLMGGDIQVKSEPGKGSIFTMYIPLQQVAPNPSSLKRREYIQSDLSQMAILVVDDNETNRLVVESMLDNLGVTVFHADSGEQALALLDYKPISSAIDLILMDVSMPEISGIEVTRIIREKNLIDKNIPIIAMTAHVQPNERQGFHDAGMDGFLGKPFQFIELIDVLQEHEQEFSHERFLKIQSETGGKVINDLVASFRRDAEKRLVALQESYEAEDWVEFSAQSHAIGSNAGMFGSIGLFRICRKVESAHREDENEIVKNLAPNLISLVIPGVEKVESWLDNEG